MKVIIDSNALYDDPTLLQGHSQRLLDLLGQAGAVLIFSPIVLMELERQRLEKIADLRDSVSTRLKSLGRLAGLETNQIDSEVIEVASQAQARWNIRWQEILGLPNVEKGKWPKISAQSMVERELSRRRPFLDKAAGAIGHRDTLIWLSVVELAREATGEMILFVSADKGFWEKEGIHPDLLADLEASDLNRVTIVRNITELIPLLASAYVTDTHVWRESAIENVIAEEILTLAASDFTPAFDPREGDVTAPTFDIGIPSTGHDWDLDHIDGPSNLEVGNNEPDTDTMPCTFDVSLDLSGFMDKWEWYGAEYQNLDLWDGDWNDHVVLIAASRHVRIAATVRVLEESRTVEFIEFTGVLEVT